VWACDADAVFMNDPRPMMRERPWTEADVAIATDCIDLPSDARYPLLHCDFNTGLVYLRSRPKARGAAPASASARDPAPDRACSPREPAPISRRSRADLAPISRRCSTLWSGGATRWPTPRRRGAAAGNNQMAFSPA
jgi:hypothetical protein